MRMKLAGLMVAVLATAVSAQQPARPTPARGTPPAQTTAAQKLPPLAYICPMPQDSEIIEDKPGKCPKCGMELIPVRLDAKYWCPTHQSLEVHDGPGKCPRDGKDLVPVTVNETWTCAGVEKPFLEPGKCADGSNRRINYALAAHGDHNPKHGGQFFMAADSWHHLEGTYPSAGVFRVHFYDNFSKPMSPRGFTGTVVILDPSFKEVASYPLSVEANNRTMLARIPAKDAALPLNAAVKIKFKPEDKEQLFNFPFSKYTVEPAAPAPAPAAPTTTRNAPAKPATPPATAAAKPAAAPSSSTAKATPPAAPATTAPAAAPAAAAAKPEDQAPLILDSPLQMPPGLAEATDETRLPKDVPGLVAELNTRAEEVGKLVNEGELAQVWLPAMGTKTVALALDAQTSALPERQRAAASTAVKQIVMAAWDIDNYGDLGDGLRIREAYTRLNAAVQNLKAIYAQ